MTHCRFVSVICRNIGKGNTMRAISVMMLKTAMVTRFPSARWHVSRLIHLSFWFNPSSYCRRTYALGIWVPVSARQRLVDDCRNGRRETYKFIGRHSANVGMRVMKKVMTIVHHSATAAFFPHWRTSTKRE